MKPQVKKNNHQEQKETSKYRQWLKSGWFTFLGILILLAIVWPLSKNLSQEKVLEREIKLAEAEIEKYEDENQKLQDLVNYLGSDQAVEAKAKLNLGMKKAGEKVVVVQEVAPTTDSMYDETEERWGNNWQRWYHYFFQ